MIVPVTAANVKSAVTTFICRRGPLAPLPLTSLRTRSPITSLHTRSRSARPLLRCVSAENEATQLQVLVLAPPLTLDGKKMLIEFASACGDTFFALLFTSLYKWLYKKISGPPPPPPHVIQIHLKVYSVYPPAVDNKVIGPPLAREDVIDTTFKA